MPDGTPASLASIFTNLTTSNRRVGAIIGPHGSGKSTLLRNLHDVIGPTLHRATPTRFTLPNDADQAKFKDALTVRSFQLQAGSTVKSQLFSDARYWHPNSWISIDGYEQLTWLDRLRLKRRLASSKSGLVVTAHRQLPGIPTVFTTPSNDEIRSQVIRHLLTDQPDLISAALAIPVDEKNQTNLREHLFRLYDWYENLAG